MAEPGSDDAIKPATGWYLCFTKPRQEAFARSKLAEQGFEAYLPEFTRWVRRSAGWQRTQQPMFPRYLFVRPTRAQQAVAPIRSTPGVTQLVRFGAQLAVMPQPKLLALRLVCEGLSKALPNEPLSPGAPVVFVHGPLKGAHGIVSAVAQQRVTVMLSLLGHEQAVWISPDAVAAA